VNGEIELKHIDFAYPSRPEMQIFTDFNLKVRGGKSLALVGASGSGMPGIVCW
jgi:ATP-binding cassette subfamily B (MDR/TAP) protein 1